MTDIYTEYCLENNITGPEWYMKEEEIRDTNLFKLHVLNLKVDDLLDGIEREMEKMNVLP